MSYAKSETPEARGGEGCSDQHPDHPYSQERVRGDGHFPGSVTIRNAGTTGEGGSIAGGILTRLIQDTQDRLNEARECIAWYEREEQKQIQRLADLEALQALADGNESESEQTE